MRQKQVRFASEKKATKKLSKTQEKNVSNKRFSAVPVKKRRRKRSGTASLKEVRRIQKSTKLVIYSKTFKNKVRDIARDIWKDFQVPKKIIVKPEAMKTLQELVEDEIIRCARVGIWLGVREKKPRVRLTGKYLRDAHTILFEKYKLGNKPLTPYKRYTFY